MYKRKTVTNFESAFSNVIQKEQFMTIGEMNKKLSTWIQTILV